MFAAINAFLTRAISGYFLNKSLRFRSSASAYLNRTFGTPTNNIKWTWSAWVKRGKLSSAGVLFQGYSSLSNRTALQFNSSDQLVFNGSVATATTTAVFRDPAAWYHIVCVYDSANATAANRLLLYVNGTVQTVTGTQPTASQVEYINGAWLHYISTGYSGAFEYLDEDLAEINFVDGQALAPTSFGAFSTYNQWLPKKYAGTYGTNGFYLPFSNTTSTSALVADSSPNGNNWTPNNISLTAGSTYDSLTDVPTLTSTTVANYAVLNPLDAATTTGVASNGNLTWTNSAATHQCIRASIAIPATGAYYFEAINVTSNNATIGVGFGLGASTASLAVNMGGSQANIFSWYSGGNANSYIVAGTVTLATFVGGAFVAGDVLQLAVDTTNTKMWLGKNNVWYNSTGGTTGNPTTGANPTFTTSMVGLFPMTEVFTNTVNFNFGQQPFTYTPPSGFLPLNTFNI